MDEIKAKQQVVEKIKGADKILVTVSDSPSVDALSAALGLALLLDKQEKYATAIFSGETPPAIAFLEPQKTFDDTTDSLRDFIIALNKEKADHLRYKVEGDSVKIFITPYKTTINQDDLDFSQGDYNVELVIAIGVDNQDHLDKALEDHGQILHDAAIITLTCGDQTSDLGGIDWHDANASSLSEMVAGLAEALKDDKKKSLLDTEISTALLTGIVAQTDRFSNEHTTSKVMTVAASLMAAGADQQLIATELQQPQTIETPAEDAEESTDDSSANDETPASDQDGEGVMSIKKDATSLTIDHEGETLAELDERVRGEEASKEKIEDEIEAIEEEAEIEAEKREKDEIIRTTPKREEQPAVDNSYILDESTVQTEEDMEEPTFGGVLNATADQAQDDARKAIEDDQNKTILNHAYIGDTSDVNSASKLTDSPAGFPGAPSVTPGSVGINEVPSDDTVHSAYALDSEPSATPSEPSIAVGGERVIEPLEHHEPEMPAFDPTTPVIAPTSPFDPVPPFAPPSAAPVDLGLPLPPPIPDFSQGLANAIPTAPAEQPQILGDILAPDPDPAPSTGMDYEMTNTVAAPGSAYAFEEVPAALPPVEQFTPEPAQAPQQPFVPQQPFAQPQQPEQIQPQQQPAATPPATPAPGQFQIPGQQ